MKHSKLYKDAYILQESFAMTVKSYPPPCRNFLQPFYLSVTLYACAQRGNAPNTLLIDSKFYFIVILLYWSETKSHCIWETCAWDSNKMNFMNEIRFGLGPKDGKGNWKYIGYCVYSPYRPHEIMTSFVYWEG